MGPSSIIVVYMDPLGNAVTVGSLGNNAASYSACFLILQKNLSCWYQFWCCQEQVLDDRVDGQEEEFFRWHGGDDDGLGGSDDHGDCYDGATSESS